MEKLQKELQPETFIITIKELNAIIELIEIIEKVNDVQLVLPKNTSSCSSSSNSNEEEEDSDIESEGIETNEEECLMSNTSSSSSSSESSEEHNKLKRKHSNSNNDVVDGCTSCNFKKQAMDFAISNLELLQNQKLLENVLKATRDDDKQMFSYLKSSLQGELKTQFAIVSYVSNSNVMYTESIFDNYEDALKALEANSNHFVNEFVKRSIVVINNKKK